MPTIELFVEIEGFPGIGDVSVDGFKVSESPSFAGEYT